MPSVKNIIRFLTLLLICFSGITLAAVDLLVSDLNDSGSDPGIRGGNISYSVTTNNLGIDAATNSVLVFPMPSDSAFNAAASSAECAFQANYDHDSGGIPDFDAVVCDLGTLAGGNGAITKNVVIVYSGAASSINVAAWATGDGDVYTPVNTSSSPDGGTNNKETQNTSINNGADLAIIDGPSLVSSATTSGDNSVVIGGGDVSYDVYVKNLGLDDVTDAKVVVTLSAVMTYTSVTTANGWSCSHAGADGNGRGGVLTCIRGALAKNSSSSHFIFKGSVTGASNGNVPSAFAVSSALTTDPDSNNDATQVDVTIAPGTDVAVTTNSASYTVTAGGTATVILRPRNHGPSASAATTVTTSLPSGFSNIVAAGAGWSCGAVGGDVTCTRPSTYSIAATDDITVTADVPLDLTTLGVLCAANPNGSYSCANLPAEITTTTAEATERQANNAVTYDIDITPFGLDLEVTSKNITPDLPVAAGDTLTSTIRVKNNGPLDAPAGSVGAVDNLDVNEFYSAAATAVANGANGWTCAGTDGVTGNVTCSYANALNVGATAPSLVIISTSNPASGDVLINNQACSSYDGTVRDPDDVGDFDATNNCKSDTVNVTELVVNSPDLSVDITNVNAGGDNNSTLNNNEDSIVFTIAVDNLSAAIDTDNAQLRFDMGNIYFTRTSPVSATAVTVNGVALGVTFTEGTVDWVCSGTSSVVCNQTAGTFSDGDGVATFLVQATRPLKDGNGLEVVATVRSTTQGDSDTANNRDTDLVTINAETDIRVTKTISPSLIEAGAFSTFTVEVANIGPSAAANVVLTDTFTIPVNDTGFTVDTITVTGGCAIAGAMSNGSVHNAAGAVSGTCTWAAIPAGTSYTVKYKVRPNFMVGDPARVLINDAWAAIDTWEINDANGDGNGEIAVGGALASSVDTNNRADATLNVAASSVELTIENSDSPSPIGPDPLGWDMASGGDSSSNDVIYEIKVTNFNGPSLATKVQFTHEMTPPEGKRAVFLCDDSVDGSCAEGAGICSLAGRQTITGTAGGASLTTTCKLEDDGITNGQLDVNDDYFHYLKYRFIDTPLAGVTDTYRTVATVSANEIDPVNNVENENTNVRVKVDLAVTKNASKANIQVTEPFNWAIRVTNQGPGPAYKAFLFDTLPANMSLDGNATWVKDSDGSTGTCAVAGQALTCDFGVGDALASSDFVDVSVPVKVSQAGNYQNCATAYTGPDSTGTTGLTGVDPVPSDNVNICDTVTAQKSSIAGTVFTDFNDDGTQAGSDTGITGVQVRLTGTDAFSQLVDITKTTNASGDYIFDNIAASNVDGYTITETTQPAGFADGLDNKGGATGTNLVTGSRASDVITTVVLATNETLTGYDFAEIPVPSISGLVWVDVNNDGVLDGDESLRIAGVRIGLTGTNSNGDSIDLEQLTDANGQYSFINLLPSNASGYTVTEKAQPVLWQDGQESKGTVAGSATGLVGIEKFSKVVLAVGQSGIDYNFGELGGSLAGNVYRDGNDNGLIDGAGETGVTGTSLVLTGLDDAANVINRVATTDANGEYIFTGLPKSDTTGYSITETQPAGLFDGKDTDGSIGGGDAATVNDVISHVVLNAGVNGIDYNFGEGGTIPQPSSSITGTVYIDHDKNGLKGADEPGLEGVTLTLTGADKTGKPVNVVVQTDRNGFYLFDNIDPDDGNGYTITEAHPAGYTDGQESVGGVVEEGSRQTDLIAILSLPAGSALTGYDFGEEAEVPATTSSISGTVYVDGNDNGLQETEEAGIEGVTLMLIGTDNSGNPINVTTMTDEKGDYVFDNVSPDDGKGYVVRQTHPTDYADGKESKVGVVDENSKLTDAFTLISLPAGTALSDYDFGELEKPLTPTSGLQGFVYADTSDSGRNNGQKDAGEQGIPNITVTLSGMTNDGVDICSISNCTQKTSATGYFNFEGIVPGTYALVETHADLPLAADGSMLYLDGKETAGEAGGSVNGDTFGSQAYQNTIAQIVVTAELIESAKGIIDIYLFGELDSETLGLVPPIINGYVYLDREGVRVRPTDGSLEGQGNWTAVLAQNGNTICQVTTNANGFYQFDNLNCPGYEAGLPLGSDFSITFTKEGNTLATEAISGGSAGQVSRNVITGITLESGDYITEQNLPLDPSGVVYDAVTREPVSGAEVTIQGPAGFDPVTHLVGGIGTQVTGSDGLYSFFLQNGFPSGVYTLEVTQYPNGYIPAPSVLIPACLAGTNGVPLNVGGAITPGLVQASDSAPALGIPLHNPSACEGMIPGGSNSTQYYFGFVITNGISAPILKNHIPIDPIVASSGSIVMSKTTPLKDVRRGELVPYTLTVKNTADVVLNNLLIRDQLPVGFKYVKSSATINGTVQEPIVEGRQLTWAVARLNIGEEQVITLTAIVGSGVSEGDYVNQTWTADSVTSTTVSNIASATVRLVPDPLFDCSDLIGKVFDDQNINGYQDDGEPGLAGVRVATPRGLLISTDEYGRFHVACADVPNEIHGSNFILKLDERTLPSGYRVTTENPRVVRLTRGKLAKLNFGAGLHRVLRLDIDHTAFKDSALTRVADKQLVDLLTELQKQPTQIRLSYALQPEEDKTEAKQRMHVFSDVLTKLWQECDCANYALTIEQELFARDGALTTKFITGKAK